jgi:hypothetical protein
MSNVSREYTKTPRKSEIIEAEKFNLAVEKKEITKWDGHGYWMKDGKESENMVFADPQLDATHVSWYNR